MIFRKEEKNDQYIPKGREECVVYSERKRGMVRIFRKEERNEQHIQKGREE